MDMSALSLNGRAIAGAEVAAVLALLGVALLLLVARLAWSGRQAIAEAAREEAERRRLLDAQMAELAGRMQTMAEVFGTRQVDVARLLAERIDQGGQRQAETLARLHERLAVIDAAQGALGQLTGEVAGLRDVLANKQARGAYGQGRMEAIVRDGLPPGAYAFQATLSNRTRPDCLVRLPGDPRGLAIDAKFPLESFTAFRAARGEEARARAAARVRADMGAHIRAVAEKYLIPGETQDLALLFVPAESLYADLSEHFDDVVQRAHRARVVIVSPALLALAIQVLQALVRDARVREEAKTIQVEVRRLVEDVTRLADRVARLDGHLRQAGEDVAALKGAADRIARHGRRIDRLDFGDAPERDLFARPGVAAE